MKRWLGDGRLQSGLQSWHHLRLHCQLKEYIRMALFSSLADCQGREFSNSTMRKSGSWLWAASPPEISIDELAPASTVLNPCKPSIVQTETDFNSLLAMSAVCLWPWYLTLQQSDIDQRSEEDLIANPTIKRMSLCSSISVPDFLEELFARRLARQCLHLTQPTTPFF